ncbi:hypothetical protein OSB04_020818 [Centaurea solstitialis]|uniref:Uncharacterized protein n=1 Tax=Centaurea solstitialis TaxID=347529 RepID=A0AA38T540_9ASTR|nr:hypothetical protein OSB04_020818 [Centaurea solstitialis]
MPRTSFVGSLSSPKVDVFIDTGNPLLNHTVDGFLKIGTVAAVKTLAEETFHVVKRGFLVSILNPCYHIDVSFDLNRTCVYVSLRQSSSFLLGINMTEGKDQSPPQPTSSFHPAIAVTNIRNLLPLTLDLEKVQFSSWAELFKCAACAYNVLDHIDASTPKPTYIDDLLWQRLDAIDVHLFKFFLVAMNTLLDRSSLDLHFSGSVSKHNVEDALKKMCKEGAYWGAVAGVYVGMEYGIERVRGTRDWKNAMIGGALTGALVSAVSSNKGDRIITDAITGGAIATAAEFISYLT